MSDQKGSTLLIPTAKDEDEGQYICIVPRATGEVTKIKHTVSIRGNLNCIYTHIYIHKPKCMLLIIHESKGHHYPINIYLFKPFSMKKCSFIVHIIITHL